MKIKEDEKSGVQTDFRQNWENLYEVCVQYEVWDKKVNLVQRVMLY